MATTTLVHETFIRLVGAGELTLADRRHFFAYTAKIMREDMESMGPVRLREVEQAQMAMVQVAKDLGLPGDREFVAPIDHRFPPQKSNRIHTSGPKRP